MSLLSPSSSEQYWLRRLEKSELQMPTISKSRIIPYTHSPASPKIKYQHSPTPHLPLPPKSPKKTNIQNPSARKANIPTLYHNLISYGKAHPSADPGTKYSPAARAAYDADLAEKVLAVSPDLVVCAGW